MTSPAADTPLVERTAFLTNKVAVLLLTAVEERLGQLGLSSRSYFVLTGIDRDVPVSQQELSRLLGIDPTTMVALVDELERAGSARRERNASDRRRYDLVLTVAGRRTLTAAHQALAAVEEEFFAPLSAAQRQRYDESLRRLLAGRWP